MNSNGIDFSKLVNIVETANIQKDIDVNAFVKGNTAMANATADAMGHNTVTETLTQTTVVQGVGSHSDSESLSATSGHQFYLT
jgi:hypothetical protein